MDPQEAARVASHLLIGKYIQLGGFVMLLYDHFLTFSQEVERVWKQRFTVASILFLINRYVTVLQFILLLDAFHDPHWAPQFEGASTVALVAVGQLIMILRIFALYERNYYVLAFLMTLWSFQIIMSSIGLRTGFPVPLPTGLTGCILTGSSPVFPSIWIAPLITDSAIFLLTLYRTKRYLKNLTTSSRTIVILVRDGTFYFLLIFLANLMNVLIYFLAEPDLKAIGASFSQLLTCTMISRLVLNLRSLSSRGGEERDVPPYRERPSVSYRFSSVYHHHHHHQSQCLRGEQHTGAASVWRSTLGNLGESISYNGSESNVGGAAGGGTDRNLNVEIEMSTKVLDSVEQDGKFFDFDALPRLK